jgi:uncharacterized protein (DUF362 family)
LRRVAVGERRIAASRIDGARGEMGSKARVFLDRLDRGYLRSIREGLAFLDIASRIRPGDTVFLKPNLTFPCYREGVMTRPECVEGLILALQDCGVRVLVGESDGGGYNRFSMDAVFAATGLAALAARHGVRLVNLSKEPSRDLRFSHGGRELAVPLPALLLDEVDLFVTVPVPKVHANTGVSMSVKNQWGCIGEPSVRLELHPFFEKVIFEVNRALRVRLSVIDGKFGLNRNGPLRGDPVELGWVLMSDDILAADAVCCRLMRIDPRRIGYLHFYAEAAKRGGADWGEECEFNRNYREFMGSPFRLRREIWDYPGYLAFRSPSLAYLAYRSPLARLLHGVLYLFRRKFYEHP